MLLGRAISQALLKASTDPFALREFLHALFLEYGGGKADEILALLGILETRNIAFHIQKPNGLDTGAGPEQSSKDHEDGACVDFLRAPEFAADGLPVLAVPIDASLAKATRTAGDTSGDSDSMGTHLAELEPVANLTSGDPRTQGKN